MDLKRFFSRQVRKAEIGAFHAVESKVKAASTTALVTTRAVPKPTVPERVRSWLSRSGTWLLLLFLAGCTVLLVLLRRRVVRKRSVSGTSVQ